MLGVIWFLYTYMVFARSRSRDYPISLLASKQGAIVAESIKQVYSFYLKFDEKSDGNIYILVHLLF